MKSRASKGLLLSPSPIKNISDERRSKWLRDAYDAFVASPANKKYYKLILELMWPEGSGIPGPHVSESDVRQVINLARKNEGKEPYADPFRRVRELQGEEGFTCIIKEGTKYQLQSLDIGPKRERREKPSAKLWKQIKEQFSYKCSHCGLPEPQVKLSPDHRVPRSRKGTNDEDNWQPLCEQCNILKSSSCQGCTLNCYVCSWAFPEEYKSIQINDQNKEKVKRMAEKLGKNQSKLVNDILTEYFNKL